MPSPAPEPLTSRPLSVWLVNPFDDIPGEGTPPLRYWSLARALVARAHDVTRWTATWSHRRKAIRTAPRGIREDEGFAVRLVAVKPESMVAMPNKACDYAAAGLAIVNSLPGELAALLDHYDAGVGYTAGDPGSLAAAIADLSADRPRLAAMRQGARRMAERELDREHTYAAFADWIETIHGGG